MTCAGGLPVQRSVFTIDTYIVDMTILLSYRVMNARQYEPMHHLITEAQSLCRALTRAQVRVNAPLLAHQRAPLAALEQTGPQTVPQIARRYGTSRQNIQILANRFAKAGLVAFIQNPEHRTSFRIQLTDQGRHLLNESQNFERQLLAGILPALKDTAVTAAAELLRRVREQVEAAEVRRRITDASIQDSASSPRLRSKPPQGRSQVLRKPPRNPEDELSAKVGPLRETRPRNIVPSEMTELPVNLL